MQQRLTNDTDQHSGTEDDHLRERGRKPVSMRETVEKKEDKTKENAPCDVRTCYRRRERLHKEVAVSLGIARAGKKGRKRTNGTSEAAEFVSRSVGGLEERGAVLSLDGSITSREGLHELPTRDDTGHDTWLKERGERRKTAKGGRNGRKGDRERAIFESGG
jgi:hypothetical protein